MDENKLEVLKSLPYEITPCCGLCLHGIFGGNREWGTCSVIKYEHLKHTTDGRQLSINKFGGCPKFEIKENPSIMFDKFVEFWRGTQEA